jgi:hypothetical protein
MSEHKFKIGQTLDYRSDRRNPHLRSGKCKIVGLLPSEGQDPQYRIRCATENFERVVWESQLR